MKYKSNIVEQAEAEEITFERDGRVIVKWIPRVKVSGYIVRISERNTPSGLAECETREEAYSKSCSLVKELGGKV